jgi:hypothetical protein
MKHIQLFEQFVNEGKLDLKKAFKQLENVYEISNVKEVKKGIFEFDFEDIDGGVQWDTTQGQVFIEDFNAVANTVEEVTAACFQYIKYS